MGSKDKRQEKAGVVFSGVSKGVVAKYDAMLESKTEEEAKACVDDFVAALLKNIGH